MTNVFKQNFVQKLWTQFQSCGLIRKMVMMGYGLLVSFAPLPLPYDDHKMEPKRLVSHKNIHLSEGIIKTQDHFEFSVR